jgi:hypothetical protein
MTERKREERERYRELMGHDGPEPPDEYRWQWEYQGTREEREGLLERLAADDPPAEQIHQDESLF